MTLESLKTLGSVLTKEQMKNVMGGGDCMAYLDGECPDCGSFHKTTGLTKAEAKQRATELALMSQRNGWGLRGMWCCDSCVELAGAATAS